MANVALMGDRSTIILTHDGRAPLDIRNAIDMEAIGMSKCAVIDMGTNSMKMRVMAILPGEAKVLADRTVITMLGEGMHETGVISSDAIDRNVAAVLEFVQEFRDIGVGEIVAVGTMALRTAKNAGEFIDRVKRESGIVVEVISGEEEARLSYLAVLSGLGIPEGNVCVFDTGGGSIEFIFGADDLIKRRFSLDVGSRRPTEEILRSDPVTTEEQAKFIGFLEKELGDLKAGVDTLVGMGGTVTSMGAVMLEMKEYDPDRIQGLILPFGEVNRQVEMYRALTIEERKGTVGLMPKRADVILAGASIVLTVMKMIGVEQLTISDRGLRHGLMYDRFQRGD